MTSELEQEPGLAFLLGFPKEGRLWDGTAGRGFPPTHLSFLYPLDCSKKDLGECGALAKLLKEGQEPGMCGSHQTAWGCQLEGQLGPRRQASYL